MRENTPKERALLLQIAKALKEAQAAEAHRNINQQFNFKRNGEGWELKVVKSRCMFHFWGDTAGLVRRITEGSDLVTYFAKNFPELKEPAEPLPRHGC